MLVIKCRLLRKKIDGKTPKHQYHQPKQSHLQYISPRVIHIIQRKRTAYGCDFFRMSIIIPGQFKIQIILAICNVDISAKRLYFSPKLVIILQCERERRSGPLRGFFENTK